MMSDSLNSLHEANTSGSRCDRNEYENNMITELVRYAELERKDWDKNSETDLSLMSIWFLQNPFGLNNRAKIEVEFNKTEFEDGKEFIRKVLFTSHSHHNEPLIASPDDILVYHRLGHRTKDFAHYITDRFNLTKIF